MTDRQVTVRARWDKDLVPTGRSSQRNLLLEITAPPKPEQSSRRAPINLALVVDRSGSMRGDRIAAARYAASGIVDALDERDRLSLVIFDNEVDPLLKGVAMDAIGKRQARGLIERVHSRGMTNLSAGWFEGAHCAAKLLERSDFTEGNVLVLSDGHANQGICDPDELLTHARELAERGIKTSAVGIGESYSPLQLDALAEGGHGRLHDAETVEDIVDVVLGELGELHAITARNVRLTLAHPCGARLDVLTRSPIDHEGDRYSLQLGDIVADASRPVAVRVDLDACDQGARLSFGVTVDWQGSREQQVPGRVDVETRLHVVPAEEADAQIVEHDVVERVATLWEAVMGYRAMRRNERRDFDGAAALYAASEADYCALVSDLPDASERVERLRSSSDRVSRQWDGRSKRTSYALSKKSMRGERDLRRSDQGEWYDHLDDDRS